MIIIAHKPQRHFQKKRFVYISGGKGEEKQQKRQREGGEREGEKVRETQRKREKQKARYYGRYPNLAAWEVEVG